MNKEWFTLANGITLFRLCLFVIFILLLIEGSVIPALIFLGSAWALDAIDGFAARSMGQASAIGSQLDKWTDRLIVVLGILFLIRASYIPTWAVFLLSKDISLLPALTIHAARGEHVAGLGWTGKAMTFFQGSGVIWLIFDWPYPQVAVAAVAAAGAAAAWYHLRQISY